MRQTLFKTKHNSKGTRHIINALNAQTNQTLFLQNAINTAYAHFERLKEDAKQADNTERATAFEEAQLILYLLTRKEG